jgi:hypothetical protein
MIYDENGNIRNPLIFDDGNIYHGEFQDDKCHGKGKLIFKQSGNIYEGSFKEGFMHG